uniref:Uncharacterized protein n=1 Tax=Trichogramma kaykai TaxID=54128 RepID=A0ABD2VV13_9HYME
MASTIGSARRVSYPQALATRDASLHPCRQSDASYATTPALAYISFSAAPTLMYTRCRTRCFVSFIVYRRRGLAHNTRTARRAKGKKTKTKLARASGGHAARQEGRLREPDTEITTAKTVVQKSQSREQQGKTLLDREGSSSSSSSNAGSGAEACVREKPQHVVHNPLKNHKYLARISIKGLQHLFVDASTNSVIKANRNINSAVILRLHTRRSVRKNKREIEVKKNLAEFPFESSRRNFKKTKLCRPCIVGDKKLTFIRKEQFESARRIRIKLNFIRLAQPRLYPRNLRHRFHAHFLIREIREKSLTTASHNKSKERNTLMRDRPRLNLARGSHFVSTEQLHRYISHHTIITKFLNTYIIFHIHIYFLRHSFSSTT